MWASPSASARVSTLSSSVGSIIRYSPSNQVPVQSMTDYTQQSGTARCWNQDEGGPAMIRQTPMRASLGSITPWDMWERTGSSDVRQRVRAERREVEVVGGGCLAPHGQRSDALQLFLDLPVIDQR